MPQRAPLDPSRVEPVVSAAREQSCDWPVPEDPFDRRRAAEELLAYAVEKVADGSDLETFGPILDAGGIDPASVIPRDPPAESSPAAAAEELARQELARREARLAQRADQLAASEHEQAQREKEERHRAEVRQTQAAERHAEAGLRERARLAKVEQVKQEVLHLLSKIPSGRLPLALNERYGLRAPAWVWADVATRLGPLPPESPPGARGEGHEGAVALHGHGHLDHHRPGRGGGLA